MPPTAVRLVASYEARDGGWVAAAQHGDNTISAFGRTLDKARQHIAAEVANKLGVYLGQVALDDSVALSSASSQLLAEARTAKEVALKAAAASHEATREAARALAAEGLSLRDVAYLLGLSHSRVHQLLSDEADREKA